MSNGFYMEKLEKPRNCGVTNNQEDLKNNPQEPLKREDLLYSKLFEKAELIGFLVT